MAEEYELRDAYFHQLRQADGLDPEAARDLGFAMSPEEYTRHLESGQLVGKLVVESTISQTGRIDRSPVIPEGTIGGFGVGYTRESSSDEQYIINQTGIKKVRDAHNRARRTPPNVNE